MMKGVKQVPHLRSSRREGEKVWTQRQSVSGLRWEGERPTAQVENVHTRKRGEHCFRGWGRGADGAGEGIFQVARQEEWEVPSDSIDFLREVRKQGLPSEQLRSQREHLLSQRRF